MRSSELSFRAVAQTFRPEESSSQPICFSHHRHREFAALLRDFPLALPAILFNNFIS
jgi:hypothetical protein